MPDISGLDFLRTLTNPPFVINTTAHKKFAIEGYELNVCDYLLKPFSFERFVTASNKVLSLKEKEPAEKNVQNQTQSETTLHDDYLVIRAVGNITKLTMRIWSISKARKLMLPFIQLIKE